MNRRQTIFTQVFDILPQNKLRRCVKRYNGDYRVLSFTCYSQFLCMVIAPLTSCESLRDIECCLRAIREKLFHILTGWKGTCRGHETVRKIYMIG